VSGGMTSLVFDILRSIAFLTIRRHSSAAASDDLYDIVLCGFAPLRDF
jgi:hypothetical protein